MENIAGKLWITEAYNPSPGVRRVMALRRENGLSLREAHRVASAEAPTRVRRVIGPIGVYVDGRKFGELTLPIHGGLWESNIPSL